MEDFDICKGGFMLMRIFILSLETDVELHGIKWSFTAFPKCKNWRFLAWEWSSAPIFNVPKKQCVPLK